MHDKEHDLLRQSVEKYRLFFDSAPLSYQSLDVKGHLLEVNQTWLDLMGYVKEDVIGHWFGDYLSPDSLQLFRDNFPNFKRDGLIQGVEFGMVRADGSIMDVCFDGRIVFGPDGEFQRTHCMFRNVTASKFAARALVDSEDRLRAFADASFEAIFMSDKGICIDQNQTAERMFGYTHNEALGRPGTDWIIPEDRDLVMANMLEGRETPYEATAMRKDGSTFAAELQARMFEYQGRQIRVTAVRDITIRKQAELEAQAGHRSFQALFEHAGDYIILVDPTAANGPIISDANSALCKIQACTREELVGRPLLSMLRHESKEMNIERLATIMSGQTITFESSFILPDGKELPLEVMTTMIDRGGEQRILAIGRDITRRRAHEKEILQTEKLQSVGVLAGGIAHDFNNLLGGILGNIAMAKQELNASGEALEMLEDAEKAATRAASLTKQLLTFSKGGAPIRVRTNIAEVVREPAEFVLSGTDVTCEFILGDDLYPVHIDRDLISQVIQNLTINAMQSMPGGGVITLEGCNISVTPTSTLLLAPGNYLCISVTDKGEGIPSEIQGNIFDPFFSTKPGGSGLGLATCFSIIQQHDGLIHVQSEMGRGATFSIYLPADTSLKPPVPADVAVEKGSDAVSTGGHLLIMDDEQMVLDLVARILRQYGYTVDCTAGADEAIAHFREALGGDRQGYDAVILDLTVRGGRGGLEVIEAMRELSPDVKALVCSGYSDDPVMADCTRYGFGGALVKPFEPEQLDKALRRLLAEG